MFRLLFQKKNMPHTGFTVLEFLIVMVVITLVVSTVAAQDRTHAARLVYDDAAYRLALTIRSAQSYGISAKEYRSSGGAVRNFCAAYGVYFALSGGSTDNYILYSELPAASGGIICLSPTWGYQSMDPVLDKFYVPAGGAITQLCTTHWLSGEDCSATSLSVSYQRPDPFPHINNDSNLIAARIVMSFTGGITRSITIRSTGQISVD